MSIVYHIRSRHIIRVRTWTLGHSGSGSGSYSSLKKAISRNGFFALQGKGFASKTLETRKSQCTGYKYPSNASVIVDD